jgi:hypothetical protein
MLARNDWVDDLEANRREAIDLARRALSVARDDPEILAFAGTALGCFGKDINAGIGMIDRALIFNPSFAHGWYCSGFLRVIAGQPDVAIEHFKTSLRLNPRDRPRKQDARKRWVITELGSCSPAMHLGARPLLRSARDRQTLAED